MPESAHPSRRGTSLMSGVSPWRLPGRNRSAMTALPWAATGGSPVPLHACPGAPVVQDGCNVQVVSASISGARSPRQEMALTREGFLRFVPNPSPAQQHVADMWEGLGVFGLLAMARPDGSARGPWTERASRIRKARATDSGRGRCLNRRGASGLRRRQVNADVAGRCGTLRDERRRATLEKARQMVALRRRRRRLAYPAVGEGGGGGSNGAEHGGLMRTKVAKWPIAGVKEGVGAADHEEAVELGWRGQRGPCRDGGLGSLRMRLPRVGCFSATGR